MHPPAKKKKHERRKWGEGGAPSPRGAGGIELARNRSVRFGYEPPRTRSVRSQSEFLAKWVLTKYNRDSKTELKGFLEAKMWDALRASHWTALGSVLPVGIATLLIWQGIDDLRRCLGGSAPPASISRSRKS